MKIKFNITVTAPAAQVGTKGEVKEVDDRAANILINGGYAERADIIVKKKSAKKKVAAKKVASNKIKRRPGTIAKVSPQDVKKIEALLKKKSAKKKAKK